MIESNFPETVNYLKKFISKPLLIPLIITIIIIAGILLSFSVKLYLMTRKSQIEQQLGNYLNQRVTIGDIYYIPPAFIILKDIIILGTLFLVIFKV